MENIEKVYISNMTEYEASYFVIQKYILYFLIHDSLINWGNADWRVIISMDRKIEIHCLNLWQPLYIIIDLSGTYREDFHPELN